MKRHSPESGYAMLLVFLMAACVAIMLYAELPRVAFEAERQHEIQLVDRGNQFKRAIQVFVTDKVNNPTHRYPGSLDELESFNNHRYLRRRYLDPMTGKDEWRLVHINGGVLTDSVTTQAGAKGQAGSGASAGSDYISSMGFMDTAGPGGAGAGGATRAMRTRPGDQQGAPGGAGMPGGSPGMEGNAGGAGIPQQQGVPGVGGVQFPPPGQQQAGGAPNNQPGQQQQQQPCQVFIGSCPPTATAAGGQPGQPQQIPGQQGAFNPGAPTVPGSIGGGMPPGAPGQPGTQNAAQTAAAGMINSLLTSPRPGGMPTTMPGAAIGGGIAGVASKFEAEGIMVINDRTAINEWEYIFDITKYRAPPNPLTGPAAMPQQGQPVGTPASQMGTMPAPPGTQQQTTTTGPGGGGGGGR